MEDINFFYFQVNLGPFRVRNDMFGIGFFNLSFVLLYYQTTKYPIYLFILKIITSFNFVASLGSCMSNDPLHLSFFFFVIIMKLYLYFNSQ